MNLSKTRFYLWLSLAFMASVGSVYAKKYQVTNMIGDYASPPISCGLSVGSIFEFPSGVCVGAGWEWQGNEYTATGALITPSNQLVALDGDKGKNTVIAGIKRVRDCPAGQTVNPNTGICEIDCSGFQGQDAPPINQAPQGAFQSVVQYCDVGTLCEAVREYGSSSGALTKSFYYTGAACVGSAADYQECPFYGGCESPPPEPEPPWEGCSRPYEDLDYLCPQDNDGDGRPDAGAPNDTSAYCNHDESGKFGCVGGTYTKDEPITDPSSPVSPPSSGGAITDPNTPPIDVGTEPDVEEPPTPPQGSHEDITRAILNQNSDLNSLLTELNKDNNQNFSGLNRQLDMLNQRQHQTRDAIIEQMQKDIDLHNNQKAVALAVGNDLKTAINANTETTKGALTGVAQTVRNTGDDIIDAIDQNRFQTALAVEQSGDATVQAIHSNTDAINQLAEHLGGTPCEPTPVNNYCENPHGVTSDYASTVYTQIHDAVTASHEEAKTGMFDAIQAQVDEPLITPTENIVRDSFSELFAILDRSNNCSALVFDTPIKTFTLDCQTSEYIKMVLGLLMYAYTVMTLIDILLDGVTPNPAGKPSATRYA